MGAPSYWKLASRAVTICAYTRRARLTNIVEGISHGDDCARRLSAPANGRTGVQSLSALLTKSERHSYS